jgi:hypothetical protein
MKQIKKDYLKKYGYTPADSEILDLYFSGQLKLTDNQENELIKYYTLIISNTKK